MTLVNRVSQTLQNRYRTYLPYQTGLLRASILMQTLSMQGFVVPDSTHYTRICSSLESVIVSGWKDETVNFFRFGEKVEPIDRSTYLQAGYESFYEQAHIFRKTYIEEVIRHEEQFVKVRGEAGNTPEDETERNVNDTPEDVTEGITPKEPEEELVIIVTDLFQDDSDITLLIDHLKEKYIKKGREVGLFGLRSQFDGTVYDIGIGEGSSLRYRSNPGDPKTFRPFYLLVLGRHVDIAHYFDRLKANDKLSEAKAIIFSRYLVDRLVTFEGSAIRLDNLISDIFVDDQDSRLKQYEIRRDADPAKITAEMKYNQLPYTMSFDSIAFDEPIAKHAPMGETKICPEAEECLEVIPMLSKNEDDNDSKLSVTFELDSRSLPGSAVYLYEVTLRPKIDTYQPPDWCLKWDMGIERDGSKTLNLVKFVSDLSLVTARTHYPKIAQFHCYIEKR